MVGQCHAPRLIGPRRKPLRERDISSGSDAQECEIDPVCVCVSVHVNPASVIVYLSAHACRHVYTGQFIGCWRASGVRISKATN